MARKHAREWNESYPQLNYIAPLAPCYFLWMTISSFKSPGERFDVEWVRQKMFDQEYREEEIAPAIDYCLNVARIAVKDGDGWRRDPRPYGAFGPEYQWKGSSNDDRALEKTR